MCWRAKRMWTTTTTIEGNENGMMYFHVYHSTTFLFHHLFPARKRRRAYRVWCMKYNAVAHFHVCVFFDTLSRCIGVVRANNSSRIAVIRTVAASSANHTGLCFCRCCKYHCLSNRQLWPPHKPERALKCERKLSLSFFLFFLLVECDTVFCKMIEFRSIYSICRWIDYIWE